jgi:MFS transporter, BCD family, chlorophyll transporter
MIALPVLIAPFRALLGFRSDTHRSAIGWKRVPYLWFGSLWQFGGLAVMPFALLVLGGRRGPLRCPFAGEVLAALAFLMTGLGLHMTQTAGLALAADRATDETRPRVVALLYVTFLLGMAVSALIVGWLLRDFSDLRLIQVVQGCAVVTCAERDRPVEAGARPPHDARRDARRRARSSPMPGPIHRGGQAGRLLAVVAVGGAGLQHAGRAAGTLWRRNPGPVGRGHHDADRCSGLRARCWALRWRRAGWRGGWTRTAWPARAS